MPETFTDFLAAVKTRLAADSDFTTSPVVTVLAEDEGGYVTEFSKQLKGCTVFAVVSVLAWREDNAAGTGELLFAVDLLESSKMNRTPSRAGYRTARQLAQSARERLRNWTPVISGETDVWTAIEADAIELVERVPLINWQFTGKCFRQLA
jgi:hypothetical protein